MAGVVPSSYRPVSGSQKDSAGKVIKASPNIPVGNSGFGSLWGLYKIHAEGVSGLGRGDQFSHRIVCCIQYDDAGLHDIHATLSKSSTMVIL